MVTVTAVILGGRCYFLDRYFSYYQNVVSLKSALTIPNNSLLSRSILTVKSRIKQIKLHISAAKSGQKSGQ